MSTSSRKLRPNHKSAGPLGVMTSLLRSSLSGPVATAIVLLLIVGGTGLLIHQATTFVINTKTVAGDNLRPTPWHMFDLPHVSLRGRAENFYKILKCQYLSCIGETAPRQRPVETNQTHSCPSYFQWIYEDLAPWKRRQITMADVNEARKHAAFRVVIVGGRLYVDFYYACVLPRVMFTLWGLLQLLDKYPGMVPDVDLMFDCMDRPSIKRSDYGNNAAPPPLFRYCSNSESFDIPFPDWSFWGWPQIDISPWTEEIGSIYKAANTVEWENRRPTAYWKGNPDVGSDVRTELLKCNSTSDWNAEIYRQNWWAEGMSGFRNSKLSDQCKNRFKIYAEGHAWSVSFKYIFGCNSPVLVAIPTYYEFFTRALMPMVHYWPIKRDRLCQSIKFAVEWGNKHTSEAKKIGSTGQDFIYRSLSMENVYDYMFHLLNEYSKLQRFKPTVPRNAKVLCKSTILCFAKDDLKVNNFLQRSAHNGPVRLPCTIAPHDPGYIQSQEQLALNNTRQLWDWQEAGQQ